MPQKKTKFVNINSNDCSSPLLPGREKCECQAIKHTLVNNCLNCGRIVCRQEGSGPCFFCGEIVLDKIERPKVLGNTKEAQKLLSKYSKLPKPKDEERQQEALAQKERLLEYDRTSARRTKVIDDQSDYFASENPWLSEDERKTLKQKHEAYLDMKNKLKRKVKITIDFAGRRIIEESSDLPLLEDFSMVNISPSKLSSDRMVEDTLECPKLMEPKFVGELERQGSVTNPTLWSSRIQDSELQEIVDSGFCLSILQPYASMIMEGIKLFEGRNWYTPIRGRLWICAGSKPPTQEMLDLTKAAYKHIVGEIEFPRNFPMGCLLGYVDMLDCIPQEEYVRIYPNGEVSDPYVMVLANPNILPIKIPIQGKQKIFKLDSHILQAAKKAMKH